MKEGRSQPEAREQRRASSSFQENAGDCGVGRFWGMMLDEL